MTAWRARPRAGEAPENAGRPSLDAVLEHYGVQVSGRTRQMVRCPLHEDRTPSCSIRLDEGLWNCHSCGAGGTSWDLLMKKESLSFAEAKEFANRMGLDGGKRGEGSDYSGSSYFGRRGGVAPAKRIGGGYKPSWRRR